MKWSVEKIQLNLFYLLVFLLPWQTRYIFYEPLLRGGIWEYGKLSLYSWDIILFILVIWLWSQIRQEFIAVFKKSHAWHFFLLFVSLAFLTGSWAPDPILSLYWGIRLLAGGILWLIVRVIKPKLSLIFLSLALAGMLQAVWGFGQFAIQDIPANKWLGVAAHPITKAGTSVLLNEGGRWLRAYGGQVHPNVLGGLLIITSLATVWLIVNLKIKNWYLAINQEILKIGLWFIYSFQLVGLFLAFSRAAWLAFFISLGLFIWRFWDKQKNNLPQLAPLVIAMLIFIIMGAVLWQPTYARLIGVNASQLEKQAIEERISGFGESQSLLATFWWRGVGLGNYTKALAINSPVYQSYVYQPVHNIFLLILTELGVVGLIFWILFIWQRLKTYRPELMIFLVPIGITIFFDHYWWTSASMSLLFWLLIALSDFEIS